MVAFKIWYIEKSKECGTIPGNLLMSQGFRDIGRDSDDLVGDEWSQAIIHSLCKRL
jgi:hypothetical protein